MYSKLAKSRNLNFGNNMEALQNAKPGSFCLNDKLVFRTQSSAQDVFGVLFSGPNLFCT